jgi:hypothetical protein
LNRSAILGLLGIRPENARTKKSPHRMGGTRWSMPQTLRSFVSRCTGVPENALADIDSQPLTSTAGPGPVVALPTAAPAPP